MSKYSSLKDYLKRSNKQRESLSYDEIEKILGFKLPKSAHRYRQWWENGGGHTQANSWLEAGWSVASVSLGEYVILIRF